MDVGICFEHILINFELIIYHFYRWCKSEWRIDGNESWVWWWNERHCIDEGENGWLEYHTCPFVLKITRMWDLFHHINDVLTEHPKAEEVWAWCQRRGAFEHFHYIIVGDDIVHDGWTDNVVVVLN